MKNLHRQTWAWILGFLCFGISRGGASVSSRDAFAILKLIVEFDNRYAGAPKRSQAVNLLKKLMRERGLQVSEMPFVSPDPKSGKQWPMVNLIGRFRSDNTCRFLLGTHFDIRHVAEEDKDPQKRNRPIPGANDGSSGVAVLLALASRFNDILPKKVGVDVVLFDGEEMGYPDVGGYCAGSSQFASRLDSLNAKPRFGIILDMVCDPKAVYKIEPYSLIVHPNLVKAIWSIGASQNSTAFSQDQWSGIGDDHIPLSRAGIPSILLIGMDYPQWHTSEDTLARCSPKRLDLIEQVLEEFVQKKSSEFLTCP